MEAKEFLEIAGNICGHCMDCFKCPLNSYCGDFSIMAKKKDEVIEVVAENAQFQNVTIL